MHTARTGKSGAAGHGREDRKTEFLYGIHPVLECLRAGRRRIFTVYMAGDPGDARFREIGELVRQRGIPAKTVSAMDLKGLSGSDQHQGLGANVSPCPTVDVFDLLDGISGDPFLLILDRIEDPQNFGALTRTALAAGVNAIVIPKDHAAPPTPAVSRASAGALEHMPICPVTNLARTIQAFRERNIWTVGLDRSADECVYDVDLRGPLAVVIGSESKGIRPLVRQYCDRMLGIPQAGPLNSLNASVAGALVMYETVRQRRSIKK